MNDGRNGLCDGCIEVLGPGATNAVAPKTDVCTKDSPVDGTAALGRETDAVHALLRRQLDSPRGLVIDQDLGLGMALWLASWHAGQPWARRLKAASLAALRGLWRPAVPPAAGGSS